MATSGKIFVTRKIPDAALDLLRSSRHKVDFWPHADIAMPRNIMLEKVAGADGLYCLITDKIDSELLSAAGPQLRVVSTLSVGYDHINVAELKKREIRLGHTPDVLTDAAAELTVALLLATSRRLFEGNKQARLGGWGTWSPLWMCGSGLRDNIVGICGLGRIGHAVAKLLIPFGVKSILYSGRNEKLAAAKEVGAIYATIDELLKQSDFVIACCALNQETKEMFNKAAFSKMKNSAIFVNMSRGGVVNQEDLVEALESNTIRAAGLDVTTPEPLPTDHPLFALDNCVILPHIATAETNTRLEMSLLAARNLLAALDDAEMPAEVQ